MADKTNNENKLSRRQFIKGVVGLGAIMAVGGGLYAMKGSSVGRDVETTARNLFQDKQVQNIRHMVTADNSTRRNIMWKSAESLANPRVRVYSKGAGTQIPERLIAAKEDFFHR